jgi:hypothetical protein
MNWIQGDKFIKLADWTYSPKVKRGDDYNNLTNTFDLNKIKNGDIIYTHTFYVKQLFEVIKTLDKGVKVITHNGDTNVDNSFVIPPCVDKWFAQNVNTREFKITSIPIGLENDRWFRDIYKKEKMLVKLHEPRKYKNLVYMNHNIGTNPAKRTIPYQILEGKPWVDSERGTNGTRFDEYLDNIYNHKFVICPEGNGIDTHRIWECLYMQTIPIVEDNINNNYYRGLLPMVLVKEWSEVTEVRLAEEIKRTGLSSAWDYELLNFDYWANKIKQL